MDIQLTEAKYADKPVLRQLMELYLYDFSEFIDCDVNEHGSYDYGYLDNYWTEADRYPFLIHVNGKLAGFVLVWITGEGEERRNLIAEFFVMKKYRHKGVGKTTAWRIFDRFPGVWQVGEVKTNVPAIRFWSKIIDEYSEGNFRKPANSDWDGPMQEFESPPAR